MPLKRSNAPQPRASDFTPDELKSLDAWIETQPVPRPTRREAILRLVKQALAGAQPKQKRSKRAASKARDMARQELDCLGDASLPAEEREGESAGSHRGPVSFAICAPTCQSRRTDRTRHRQEADHRQRRWLRACREGARRRAAPPRSDMNCRRLIRSPRRRASSVGGTSTPRVRAGAFDAT